MDPRTGTKRTTLAALALSLATLLAACGGGGGGGGGGQQSLSMVGAAGGTVAGPNGAEVVIPQGALAADTPIEVTQSASGAPATPPDFLPFGQVFAFTPHGASFAQPVTVTVPLDPAQVPAGATPVLYKTTAGHAEWEPVPDAVFSAGTASAQVTSFSFFRFGLRPPQITRQPVDASVVEPDPASFSVTALGTRPFTYQWQRSDDGGRSFTDIAGATTGSLTTPATTVAADDDGRFRVVIGNAAGSATSQAATLRVTTLPIAPAIATQPQDVSVAAGSNANFMVVASGTSPQYQWQRSNDGGTTFADIAGATHAGLVLSNVLAADDNARLRAQVSNAAGNVTSNAATLSVFAGPLAIVLQPRDKSLIEGGSAQFDVQATGSGLSYQWQRAPNRVAPFADLSGQTAPALTLAVVPLAENGSRYRVIVSDGAGTVTSDAATLRVSPVGSAARVVVLINRPRVQVFDNSIATAAAPEHSATADLGAGTFAATAVAIGPRSSSDAFADLFQVKLINNSGAPVTIAAGALRAHFEGAYTHAGPSVGALVATATSVSLFLNASAPGSPALQARADHQVSFTYASTGALIASSNNLRKVAEVRGARVDVASAPATGVNLDLVMPEIVLDPGATLFVSLALRTSAQNAMADFTTTPARLTLALPPGVTLDNDAVVPLTWVN